MKKILYILLFSAGILGDFAFIMSLFSIRPSIYILYGIGFVALFIVCACILLKEYS